MHFTRSKAQTRPTLQPALRHDEGVVERLPQADPVGRCAPQRFGPRQGTHAGRSLSTAGSSAGVRPVRVRNTSARVGFCTARRPISMPWLRRASSRSVTTLAAARGALSSLYSGDSAGSTPSSRAMVARATFARFTTVICSVRAPRVSRLRAQDDTSWRMTTRIHSTASHMPARLPLSCAAP